MISKDIKAKKDEDIDYLRDYVYGFDFLKE